MQITLNVDAELFNNNGIGEAIKDLFNSISDEEKRDILKNILIQYLNDTDIIKNYFINQRYVNYTRIDQPTDEFRKLIQKIDMSTEMEDIKKKMINIIENDLQNVLVELFVRNFVNNFQNTLTQDTNFQNYICSTIISMINK
jgi:hypothetical protein